MMRREGAQVVVATKGEPKRTRLEFPGATFTDYIPLQLWLCLSTPAMLLEDKGEAAVRSRSQGMEHVGPINSSVTGPCDA
jgi:hypothetical protein